MEDLSESFLKRFEEFKDLEIAFIVVAEENGCTFYFKGGSSMTIFDDGQSCCEIRWMTCDDELKEHKGAHLTGMALLESTLQTVECADTHDCSFLRIDTTAGSFRLCMHNQHNGWYGGFDPSIRDGV